MTARFIPLDERRQIPCRQGHSRDDAFEFIGTSGKPQLKCRTCNVSWVQAWRDRQRGNRPKGRPGRPKKAQPQ